MSHGSFDHLHLAVALDGTGWHPASWREPDARPADLLTPGYWTDLVGEAERGLLDFVTIEDALTLQSDDPLRADDRTDRVRGRLDAVLIASRVAPRTRHIGLVPTAVATHTEPFHLSKAIATLDYVSSGRAGIRVQVTASPRRGAATSADATVPDVGAGLLDEAADYVEVLRRLWDSWEDDAEIRDVAIGRFVDRNEAALHRLRRGHGSPSRDRPSRRGRRRASRSSPRSATARPRTPLIAGSADIGFVTPHDATEVTDGIVDAISSLPGLRCRHRSGCSPTCVVFLDDTPNAATRATAPTRRPVAGVNSSATQRFSSAPRRSSPTCCRSGMRQARPGSGCAPPRFRTTCARSPTDWSPSCAVAACSATPTRRSTLRDTLGLSRPANRYVDRLTTPGNRT